MKNRTLFYFLVISICFVPSSNGQTLFPLTQHIKIKVLKNKKILIQKPIGKDTSKIEAILLDVSGESMSFPYQYMQSYGLQSGQKESDRMYFATKEGLSGIVLLDGTVIIPMVYDRVWPIFEKKLFLIGKYGQVAVIDINNEIIIPYGKIKDVLNVRDNYIGVQPLFKKKKVAYDFKGNQIPWVEPIKKTKLSKKNGLTLFRDKEFLAGCINHSGDTIIQAKYKSIDEFNDSLLLLRDNNDHFTLVDTNNVQILDFGLEKIYSLSKNSRVVKSYNKKFNFISTEIKLMYDQWKHRIIEGPNGYHLLSEAPPIKNSARKMIYNYSLHDSDGNIIRDSLNLSSKSIRTFFSDYHFFITMENDGCSSLYSYNGSKLITDTSIQIIRISKLEKNRILITIKENNAVGIVDATGKVIMPYDSLISGTVLHTDAGLWSSYEKYAKKKLKRRLKKAISGKKVKSPKIKRHLRNSSGKIIFEDFGEYKMIKKSPYLLIKKPNGGFGMYDINGTKYIANKYDDIKILKPFENIFQVFKGDQIGIIKIDGIKKPPK